VSNSRIGLVLDAPEVSSCTATFFWLWLTVAGLIVSLKGRSLALCCRNLKVRQQSRKRQAFRELSSRSAGSAEQVLTTHQGWSWHVKIYFFPFKFKIAELFELLIFYKKYLDSSHQVNLPNKQRRMQKYTASKKSWLRKKNRLIIHAKLEPWNRCSHV
jgi:hypothetical protein